MYNVFVANVCTVLVSIEAMTGRIKGSKSCYFHHNITDVTQVLSYLIACGSKLLY